MNVPQNYWRLISFCRCSLSILSLGTARNPRWYSLYEFARKRKKQKEPRTFVPRIIYQEWSLWAPLVGPGLRAWGRECLFLIQDEMRLNKGTEPWRTDYTLMRLPWQHKDTWDLKKRRSYYLSDCDCFFFFFIPSYFILISVTDIRDIFRFFLTIRDWKKLGSSEGTCTDFSDNKNLTSDYLCPRCWPRYRVVFF